KNSINLSYNSGFDNKLIFYPNSIILRLSFLPPSKLTITKARTERGKANKTLFQSNGFHKGTMYLSPCPREAQSYLNYLYFSVLFFLVFSSKMERKSLISSSDKESS